MSHRRGRLAGWLTLVGGFSALSYVARYAGPTSDGGRSPLYQYSNAVGAVVQFALLFAFTYAIAAGDARTLFALRRPRSWGRALGLALLALVAVYVWVGIASHFPLPESPAHEQGLTPEHWRSRFAGPFAANALPVVLLAPIVEETLFRGVGYGLLERFGRPVAIVGSALAWGLAHGLVVGLIVLVPFGIALGVVRARTDSVLPGMLAHATFNGLTLLAIVLSG